MIKIENVSLEFPNDVKGEDTDKYKALDNITIEIPDGSVYGFLGSNGAGKSTLMRMISGVYDTKIGKVEIDGERVFNNPEAKGKIFFVNDETIQYSSLTLEEMRRYYRNYYVNFSDEVFDRLVKKLDLPLKKRMSAFSKGMKRQAVVVVGLACQTKYLMLDEAFDGLDPAMRKIIKKMIAEEMYDRNATLIVSSHNIAEISELCDRAMLIHKGELIFADEIDEIRSGFCKAQIAFKNKTFTKEDIEKTGVQIMDYSSFGSVAQLIVRGNSQEAMDKLKTLAPDILELVPLTLEEIFVYELEVRGYGNDILEKD